MLSFIKKIFGSKPAEVTQPEAAPYKVETAPAPTPAPAKKEDSSIGWLVFGGVVLVLTVGAVNLMKKK